MLPKKSNWEVIEHYNPRGGLTGVPSSQTKVGAMELRAEFGHYMKVLSGLKQM
jgi:hypothetical protein